jgi:hypothetical protein
MDRVLGVAIGIATVCLIFSIFASHVQELWAAFSARRAASLEAAIGQMLSDSQLTQSFFAHPLIADMSFSPTRSSFLRGSAPLAPRPSYVASDQFNKVLQSILTKASSVKATDLPSLIEALPDSPLKNRLKTLTLGIEQDVAASNTAVEKWYDDTMDRVNGLYKRNTQKALLFLGLLLAVSCNVNLLRVGSTLWSSAATRNQVEAVAQLYGCKDSQNCSLPQYDDARKAAEKGLNSLPLGYDRNDVAKYWSDGCKQPRLQFLKQLLRDGAYNFFGWILAAIAISLGAPFWFDLINKLINIRMVGQKPATSGEQKATEPKKGS